MNAFSKQLTYVFDISRRYVFLKVVKFCKKPFNDAMILSIISKRQLACFPGRFSNSSLYSHSKITFWLGFGVHWKYVCRKKGHNIKHLVSQKIFCFELHSYYVFPYVLLHPRVKNSRIIYFVLKSEILLNKDKIFPPWFSN